MYYSELVKDEKIANAIAPPVVCRIERTCISVKPHLKHKPNSNSPDDDEEKIRLESKKVDQIISKSNQELNNNTSSSVSRSNSSSNSIGDQKEAISDTFSSISKTKNDTDIDEHEVDVILDELDDYEYQEDILYFDKAGELFKVFHEVGDQGEWYWAQSYRTNECGLLLAECVEFVVRQMII